MAGKAIEKMSVKRLKQNPKWTKKSWFAKVGLKWVEKVVQKAVEKTRENGRESWGKKWLKK